MAFKFKLTCSECDWINLFWTSKKKKKSKSFDINSRMFYAMRRCGKGYQALKTFLTLINHPPPMTEKNYRKIANNFNKAIKKVALEVMQQSCKEVVKLNAENSTDVVDTASCFS